MVFVLGAAEQERSIRQDWWQEKKEQEANQMSWHLDVMQLYTLMNSPY